MGTKDLTHEEIARALTNGDPLTHEQRSVLLGLVADDKVWQRDADRLRQRIGDVRRVLDKASCHTDQRELLAIVVEACKQLAAERA